MSRPFLSVVIPAYNEASNFTSGKLDEAYQYLKEQPYSFEMVLADDGSTDNTLELLKQFSQGKPEVSVYQNPHHGKGPTVTVGMLKAEGQNRLYTDFDQSTPISEVEKLLPFRTKGYDVIIGSREVKGSQRLDEPWYRHLMGRGFNFLVWLLTVRGIHDTQCGFKLFSREATEKLFPRLTVSVRNHPIKHPFTGAFDVELLFMANLIGFNIAEVPVIWHHIETKRVSPVKDSLRMFWEVVRIRWAHLRGVYREATAR